MVAAIVPLVSLMRDRLSFSDERFHNVGQLSAVSALCQWILQLKTYHDTHISSVSMYLLAEITSEVRRAVDISVDIPVERSTLMARLTMHVSKQCEASEWAQNLGKPA